MRMLEIDIEKEVSDFMDYLRDTGYASHDSDISNHLTEVFERIISNHDSL